MKKLMVVLMCFTVVALTGSISFAQDDNDITAKHKQLTSKLTLSAGSQAAKIGTRAAITTAPVKKIDPYKIATLCLMSIVNPDSYKLVSTKAVGMDTIIYAFSLPSGSTVNVSVNKLTATASMDKRIQEALTAARANAALHTGVEIGTVHVNGVEDISNNLAGIAHRISLRVNNLDVGFIYSQQSATTHMQPLYIIDRTTGVDVLKKAVDYLSEAVNPRDFPVKSWAAYASGTVSFKFALNREQFNKPDYIIMVVVDSVTGYTHTVPSGVKEWIMAANELMKEYFNTETSHIVDMITVDRVTPNGEYLFYIGYEVSGIEVGTWVNRTTGVAQFSTIGDMRLASVVRESRQNIASHMGLEGTEKVYINYFSVIESYSYNLTMSLTFRVDNYTVNVQYDYHYNPLPGWQGISLRSFTDNNTGRDYVEKAREQLGNLFNINSEDSSKFMVRDWAINDGALQLNMYDGKGGADVSMLVTINLSTGYIAIDQAMVDSVMSVRNDVSRRLNTDIKDVHVTGLLPVFEGKTGLDPNKYYFIISTPQFALKYEHNIESGVTKLASCKNSANGIDLYANAVSYLQQNYGESPNLTNWNIEKNGISILFDFKLANGEIVKIGVVIGTGESQIRYSPGAYLNAEISQQKTVEAQVEVKRDGKNYTVSGQMASAPKEVIPVQKKQ